MQSTLCQTPTRVTFSPGSAGKSGRHRLPMAEISHFAAIVLVVTAGFALAVLSTKLTERVPVPVPAILLVASAVASDLWPRLNTLPIRTVERIAVVALVVILFNGGLDIGWRR